MKVGGYSYWNGDNQQLSHSTRSPSNSLRNWPHIFAAINFLYKWYRSYIYRYIDISDIYHGALYTVHIEPFELSLVSYLLPASFTGAVFVHIPYYIHSLSHLLQADRARHYQTPE